MAVAVASSPPLYPELLLSLSPDLSLLEDRMIRVLKKKPGRIAHFQTGAEGQSNLLISQPGFLTVVK